MIYISEFMHRYILFLQKTYDYIRINAGNTAYKNRTIARGLAMIIIVHATTRIWWKNKTVSFT